MAIGLSRDPAPPAPAAPADAPRRGHPRRRRRIVVAGVLGFVLLVMGVAAWIGVRAILARQELDAALPSASAVRQDILKRDFPAARSAADDLARHADRAAQLTSDPIWRVVQTLPLIGPNLSAVSTGASAIDSVAAHVVRPLVTVAASVDPRGLSVPHGRVDLGPLVASVPTAVAAQNAFHAAQRSIAAIDTSSTISPVGSAVARLRAVFDETAPAVDAVGNGARLLPSMLGAGGPRNYLIVAQNPAELRATGGLIGSMALVHVDHGVLSLVTQNGGTQIGPWDRPVVPVAAATQGLFGPLVGRFIQDVNLAPDFPSAAATAAAMWTRTYGGTVDGVVALDPVVFSGLLAATGPVALPTGGEITADNAVRLLLSDAYQRTSDSDAEDAFFSAAAFAVFEHIARGGVDVGALVTELADAGSAHRILIWSAHGAEEKVLDATTLAGTLPVSTPSTAALGVYFDDATGAKMDYYLKTRIAAGSAVCRTDGEPTAIVRVTLTNAAPADAATTLSTAVTGGGHYGVPAGSILTRVAVYGPQGGLLVGTRTQGGDYPTAAGVDRGRPASVFTVGLAPGQSKTVEVDFLDLRQRGTGFSVAATPTLPGDGSTPIVGARTPIDPIVVDCSSVVK